MNFDVIGGAYGFGDLLNNIRKHDDVVRLDHIDLEMVEQRLDCLLIEIYVRFDLLVGTIWKDFSHQNLGKDPGHRLAARSPMFGINTLHRPEHVVVFRSAISKLRLSSAKMQTSWTKSSWPASGSWHRRHTLCPCSTKVRTRFWTYMVASGSAQQIAVGNKNVHDDRPLVMIEFRNSPSIDRVMLQSHRAHCTVL